MKRFAWGRWLASALPALLFVGCLLAGCAVAAAPPGRVPADSTGRTRVHILPTPGPGNRVQLHLNRPPAGPLLVTIQDRLGHTHYQRWHAAGNRIVVHLDDAGRSLSPGLYSAVVSAGNLFVKTKFVVE